MQARNKQVIKKSPTSVFWMDRCCCCCCLVLSPSRSKPTGEEEISLPLYAQLAHYAKISSVIFCLVPGTVMIEINNLSVQFVLL